MLIDGRLVGDESEWQLPCPLTTTVVVFRVPDVERVALRLLELHVNGENSGPARLRQLHHALHATPTAVGFRLHRPAGLGRADGQVVGPAAGQVGEHGLLRAPASSAKPFCLHPRQHGDTVECVDCRGRGCLACGI